MFLFPSLSIFSWSLPFLPTSFPCPWYQKVPLSLALSPRIISEVARFKPDIIHASSPGIMASIYDSFYLFFVTLFDNLLLRQNNEEASKS